MTAGSFSPLHHFDIIAHQTKSWIKFTNFEWLVGLKAKRRYCYKRITLLFITQNNKSERGGEENRREVGRQHCRLILFFLERGLAHNFFMIPQIFIFLKVITSPMCLILLLTNILALFCSKSRLIVLKSFKNISGREEKVVS